MASRWQASAESPSAAAAGAAVAAALAGLVHGRAPSAMMRCSALDAASPCQGLQISKAAQDKFAKRLHRQHLSINRQCRASVSLSRR